MNPSDLIRTDVLVVGAGPTGLALAATLRKAGVDAIIVDRLPEGQNTSRAAVLHAHTMDVLDRLGAAERLAALGLKLQTFSIRDRDRTLVRLRFDDLPSRYSYLLMLPQDQTERVLAEVLDEAGGRVWRGAEVTSLTQTPTGVRAAVALSSGRGATILASYVAGADGMKSIVRQAAGIGFSGSTYEDSFVLADVEMEWAPGRDEVALLFSPAGLLVVAPLPHPRRFRIVATLAEAPPQPSIADIQALVDERGPRGGGRVLDVIWGSRFRIHHRVADHYRRDRYLLVGDAAHVHSPAGGQGMNTGLVDACVLGELLADVCSGRRDPIALDQYETLRRPAALSVLTLAGRLTRMATMTGRTERLARNLLLRMVNVTPAGHRLKMNLSGLSRRAAAELPA
jgi:2-polyprenyl-6-methoxyphenol hydroxylase-like FAD-dependent oxidoreductase